MEPKLRTISMPGSPKRVIRIAAPTNAFVGIVKQVLCGDTIVLHGFRGSPPAEKELSLFGISAPKMGRRPSSGAHDVTQDEPWAWEARDFLRKKLIGQKVFFTFIKGQRTEYGYVWVGENRETAENVIESMLREGLVFVKRDLRSTPEVKFLHELESEAKAAARGKWSRVKPIVRNVIWTTENATEVVKHYGRNPVKAIIEYVRDGSTIRGFLLPEFRYITMIISGIRCPELNYDIPDKKNAFAEEAKFFVEQRLLNRDVEVILETNINNTFVGTILHPRGNIAEALLREGLAKCVDWSLHFMSGNVNRYRTAESIAREKHIRLWKNYVPRAQPCSEFFGHVIEVFLGDSINVKLSYGEVKRVYLASIRVPREDGITEITEDSKRSSNNGSSKRSSINFRPLYDTPFLFETREFLRRKLIGKRVHCVLAYVAQQTQDMPEKCFYTVLINKENIAEALVGEGLATCIHFRMPDCKRPLFYDQMLLAECAAIEQMKGMHNKNVEKLPPVIDLTIDHKRIRTQFLPVWQRADRIEAVVEYLTGCSRLRLYLPKYRCLVAFSLSGITGPRATRQSQGKFDSIPGDPFGDEALEYSRQLTFQRDVIVQIQKLNKKCNAVVGWLWVDKINLSIALMQQGYAELHVSSQTSEFYRPLKNAEKHAKIAKRNIWSLKDIKDKEEPLELTIASDQINGLRVVNLENVLITEITTQMTFYAQQVCYMTEMTQMTNKLQEIMTTQPTVPVKDIPKVGSIYAANFSVDGKWYRAKVEYIKGKAEYAGIIYIDYGNREEILVENLVMLPEEFTTKKAYANEYALALVEPPVDNEDKEQALRIFASEVLNKIVLMNIELEPTNGLPLVTLYSLNGYKNICREMIGNGHVLVEQRTEPKLQLLLQQYNRLEETSFYARLGIWKYGDSTEDNAPEFGC